MKLKINKACDLNSISVLPPYARFERRSSTVPNGTDRSRSQPSQQSSQHGMFSQLSQNSLDEIVTNDQRIGSQERENSVKKIDCLPPISYMREESQMPISRSSANLMRKWNSASAADHQCQISEELERRIGIIETSLNRFGMILDSVQSDIMHVNKGTKEALMEMESIQQKLIANDNLMQLMNKGQEDVKTNLVGGLKSISDQVSQEIDRDRLKEISSMISAFPEQIDLCLQKLKSELCKTVTQEMQAIPYTLRIPSQKHLTPTVLSERGISCRVTPQQMPTLKNPQVRPKFCGKATVVPKVELGSWTSVKKEKAAFTCRGSSKEHRQKRLFPTELERERRIVIESDEEIDVGFSCLLEEKDTDIGNYSMEEAKEETKRILRKARREKRKYSNAIILI
ncbi:protein PAIR1-like [Camellia sinensis]|uniref:protein PAIR1-like n=1 Tax=Camellia sinensis TaxID=4442 RepID=UPI0010364C55|nr:protein PAIR1-like [Camellia sinensis]XP_028099293.1 protein PAIR1-like [Camellia sinensis]